MSDFDENPHAYNELHLTKVICTCDKMILFEDIDPHLGVRCAKCGLNAETRINEYIEYLYGSQPKLSAEERTYLKYAIAVQRELNLSQGDN